ncbi:MAG: hypothetical protein Q8N82_06050, partial [Deltaproteobacteria bacterium]|nr:hypothetical protein [Deltaproteobacteria bacterium]
GNMVSLNEENANSYLKLLRFERDTCFKRCGKEVFFGLREAGGGQGMFYLSSYGQVMNITCP